MLQQQFSKPATETLLLPDLLITNNGDVSGNPGWRNFGLLKWILPEILCGRNPWEVPAMTKRIQFTKHLTVDLLLQEHLHPMMGRLPEIMAATILDREIR